MQTCKGLSQRPQDKSALTVNKTIKTVVVIKETVLTLNWSSIMTLVQVACARGAEMWSRERERELCSLHRLSICLQSLAGALPVGALGP